MNYSFDTGVFREKSPDPIDCRVQIPREKKLTMQYAEIPGNSRPEFYDGKFPGIPEREFPVVLMPLCVARGYAPIK